MKCKGNKNWFITQNFRFSKWKEKLLKPQEKDQWKKQKDSKLKSFSYKEL